MIEQLSKTKVWAEFVEFVTKHEPVDFNNELNKFVLRTSSGVDFDLSDRELLSLLVEFCDSKGYHIGINYDEEYFVVIAWGYPVFILRENDEPQSKIKYFSTRPEATQQAVVKCFQLIGEGK